MLKLVIPKTDGYDEEKNEFFEIKQTVLQLEHSLVSLSKWESRWQKPFLSKERKTLTETIDYVRCMTVTQNVDQRVYHFLSDKHIEQVNTYVEAAMTATTIKKQLGSRNKEIITSEIIYYWMITYNIPFECQKWHLNRLMTLINVCNIKSHKPKKMSKRETMAQNAALNASRRQALQSRG